jgi:hypothetical protein
MPLDKPVTRPSIFEANPPTFTRGKHGIKPEKPPTGSHLPDLRSDWPLHPPHPPRSARAFHHQTTEAQAVPTTLPAARLARGGEEWHCMRQPPHPKYTAPPPPTHHCMARQPSRPPELLHQADPGDALRSYQSRQPPHASQPHRRPGNAQLAPPSPRRSVSSPDLLAAAPLLSCGAPSCPPGSRPPQRVPSLRQPRPSTRQSGASRPMIHGP